MGFGSIISHDLAYGLGQRFGDPHIIADGQDPIGGSGQNILIFPNDQGAQILRAPGKVGTVRSDDHDPMVGEGQCLQAGGKILGFPIRPNDDRKCGGFHAVSPLTCAHKARAAASALSTLKPSISVSA